MASRTDLRPGYINGRTAIVLIADFSNQWKLLEKTYGYKSARIKIPYKQGAGFWVDLNLIAQPRTTASEASQPPEIRLDEDDGPFHFEIENRRLTIIIPLDRPELWATVKGKTTPLLYIDRSTNSAPLCGWKNGIWLDLRVWITSDTERIPTVQYENSQPGTVSGGQFESNRKRH